MFCPSFYIIIHILSPNSWCCRRQSFVIFMNDSRDLVRCGTHVGTTRKINVGRLFRGIVRKMFFANPSFHHPFIVWLVGGFNQFEKYADRQIGS